MTSKIDYRHQPREQMPLGIIPSPSPEIPEIKIVGYCNIDNCGLPVGYVHGKSVAACGNGHIYEIRG